MRGRRGPTLLPSTTLTLTLALMRRPALGMKAASEGWGQSVWDTATTAVGCSTMVEMIYAGITVVSKLPDNNLLHFINLVLSLFCKEST